MKAIKGLFLFCFLGGFASSCFTPPEYSNIPQISFNKIQFKVTPDILDVDTLILFIDFKDGDGDLGLADEFLNPPFNPENYFLDNDNKLISIRTRKKPGFEDLPPYEFPYTCINYTNTDQIIYFRSDFVDKKTYNVVDSIKENQILYYGVKDTIYFKLNENHHNIKVEFFVKEGGTFSKFDWITAFPPQCGETFDGRFPVLSTATKPLEGTIKYSMESIGFLPLFSIKTLKLRISIKDRALNTSNVLETEFTLDKIRVN